MSQDAAPTSFVDDARLALELNDMRVPEVVAPSDRHVLLRDMRFHFLDWGGTGTQALVFVHGIGLTAHTWDLVCLALRDRYRCYALDLRGHGDSEWSAALDYRIESHAGDLGSFVEALGLADPIIVGMSLGGMTSVAHSRDHNPRALVVIDIGPQTVAAGSRAIADFLSGPTAADSLEDLVAKAVEFNPLRDPRLLRRSLLFSTVLLPDGKRAWKNDRRRLEHPFPPDRQTEQRTAVWSGIERIACPTLVVRGGKSPLFTREGAAAFAEALPNGRWVEVPDAGHTVQGDNPKVLVAELEKFLAEVAP